MKTRLFLLTFLFSVTTILNAQQWQVDLSSGYSINTTPQFGYAVNGNSSTGTLKFNTNSFGLSQGLKTVLNVNYQLRPGLGLRLGASHIFSGPVTVYDYLDTYVSGNYERYDIEKVSFSFSVFDVNAGLTFTEKLNDKFSLFFSAGPLFRVYSNLTSEEEYSYKEYYLSVTYTDDQDYQKTEYKDKFTLGFYSEMGVNYQLNQKFGLFFTSSLRTHSYSFKSSEVVEMVSNGVDQLPFTAPRYIKTEFLDSYDNDFSNDDSQPYKTGSQSFLNSGLSFLVGARYSFGKTVEEPVLESEDNGKFFLQFGGGYGLTLNGEFLSSSQSEFSKTHYESEAISFGSGVNFSFQMGYRILKNISVELGTMYNQTQVERYANSDYSSGAYISISNRNYTYDAAMLRTTAGFRIERNKNKMGAYIRTGLSTGVMNKLVLKTNREYESGPVGSTSKDYSEVEEKYAGRLSFGVYGAVGLVYSIKPGFGVFVEANMVAQNWAPEKSEIITYSENGQDLLPMLSINDKNTVYYDHYEGSADTNNDEPEIDIKTAMPYSVTVLSLGIRLNLGQKSASGE